MQNATCRHLLLLLRYKSCPAVCRISKHSTPKPESIFSCSINDPCTASTAIFIDYLHLSAIRSSISCSLMPLYRTTDIAKSGNFNIFNHASFIVSQFLCFTVKISSPYSGSKITGAHTTKGSPAFEESLANYA